MAFEQFYQYQKAVEQDLLLDDMKLDEIVKVIPSKKHFWVGRLVEAKIDLRKLETAKRKAIQDVNSRQQPKIGLSQKTVESILDKNEIIQKINDRIEEQKLIIEYLEKVEKIFSSTTYDVKNMIDLQKMERM